MFSTVINIGTKENLYLFNLQFVNLHLLPDGINTYSLCQMCFESPVILRSCLHAVGFLPEAQRGDHPNNFPSPLNQVINL